MSLSENLTLIGVLVTAIGSISAFVGIVFIWFQVRASRRIAQGEFILRLGELLNDHEDASRVLLDTQWKPDTTETNSAALVEMIRYMEVFDQMKILIDYHMIEPDVFQRLFGYRLYFIVMNDYLYEEQLMKNAQWWPDTIALSKLMAKYPIVDGPEPNLFKWSAFQERVHKLP